MTYGDFKDLNRRTLAEVLHDKAFNIAKDSKYDGYQRGHASINFLIKKLMVVVLKRKIFLIKN